MNRVDLKNTTHQIMKTTSWCILFILLPAAALAATTYNVGGDSNWTVPTNPSFYGDWVSNITFSVGDSLVFKWTSIHDVLQVTTKSEYEECKKTNGILKDKSPVTVPLTENGTFYFICSIGSHCQLGQKIAIIVGDGKSSSSSSAPPPKSSANPSLPSFSFLLFTVLVSYFFS